MRFSCSKYCLHWLLNNEVHFGRLANSCVGACLGKTSRRHNFFVCTVYKNRERILMQALFYSSGVLLLQGGTNIARWRLQRQLLQQEIICMRWHAVLSTLVFKACWSTQPANCRTTKRSKGFPAYPSSPMLTSLEFVSNNQQRHPSTAPAPTAPHTSRSATGVRMARDHKVQDRQERGVHPPQLPCRRPR